MNRQMMSPDNVPNPQTMGMPPGLQEAMARLPSPPAVMPQPTGIASNLGIDARMLGAGAMAAPAVPSFQDGGMIGMGGAAIPPGAVPGMPMQAGVNPEMQAGAPMDPQMLQMQINQFINKNPQQVAEIRQAIVQELQSGELTPQELNMIVQLATVAAQNPDMYPNVRNFAIQQGIASEQDLPVQYDQGLVFVLLLAARAVQQDLGGAPAGTGQPPGSAAPVIPSMAAGGKIASSADSKPVLIEAHTGEYVIPKHVVDMKGKEFFDSLVEKYKENKNG